MHSHLVLIAFAVIPCAMAFPGGRGGPGGPGGPHGPRGPPGPLREVFGQLTEEQKQQVHQIFEDNRDSTKAQQKAAIDNFVSTLSSDLQTKVKEGKSKFEQMIAEQDQKVKSLSQNAQDIYSQVTAILKDDSITRPEEHKKIQAIVQNADKSVLDELKNAGIRLPLGPPHGHGGPHRPSKRHAGPGGRGGPKGPLDKVFRDLTDEQKEQVRKIFEENRNATKAQQKTAIDNFVSTLSSDLQEKVKESKAKFEKRIAEQDQKAKSLSQNSENFYSQVTAILKDDNITHEEEHKKIHDLVKNVDKSVLDELRNAGIKLPLGPPHGHGGPHSGPFGRHGGPGPKGPLREIFKDLTQEQREQVRKIFEETYNATKAQQKAATDKFISTLSSELQKKVQDGKAKFEKKIAEDDDKVKSLSQGAQDFYSKVKAVLKDDSITRPEEHERIHTIVQSVDKSVLDELRTAEIGLPLGPPHGPHGRRGNPHRRHGGHGDSSSSENNDFTPSSNNI